MSDPLYGLAGPKSPTANATNSNYNSFCDKRQRVFFPSGCPHGFKQKEDGTFCDRDGEPIETISVYTININGVTSDEPIDAPILGIINPNTIVADLGDCCLGAILCLKADGSPACGCRKAQTEKGDCDPDIVDQCGESTSEPPEEDPKEEDPKEEEGE